MVLRKKERIPNVLTIAGVDPSGGAGLLADVKAMSARGVFAAGVPTALTAQNTRGVSGVMPVPPEFVAAELEAVMSDLDVAAVKIGMLNDAEVIGVVAEALERRRPRWIVLDPVMIAKSGDRLLREDALEALRRRLLPLATLVTSNLPEAAALLDEPVVADESAMPALAGRLAERFGTPWTLVKGGHLEGAESPDCLRGPEGGVQWLRAPRTETRNTHGTGCTLSSAIAAELAKTNDVPAALEAAKRYLTGAVAHADELDAGGGHGPTHHFWELWQK